MRNRLRFDLSYLASTEFQRQCIVGGTKDSYIDPGDLLDSATNGVEVILAQPILSRSYNDVELHALRNFLEVVHAAARAIPSDLSWEEIVERNAGWDTIRSTAQSRLDALGLKVTLGELMKRATSPR